MTQYTKAIWAFASTVVGALIVAVTAVPSHSLRDVGTLGWLTLAASILFTTGGVYGLSNAQPEPAPEPAIVPAGPVQVIRPAHVPSPGNPPVGH